MYLTFYWGRYILTKKSQINIITNCNKWFEEKEHSDMAAYNKETCSKQERSKNDFWGSIPAIIWRMSWTNNLDNTSENCFFSWLGEFGASRWVLFKLQVDWNSFLFFKISCMDPEQHLFPSTMQQSRQDRNIIEWNFPIALLEIIVLWNYIKIHFLLWVSIQKMSITDPDDLLWLCVNCNSSINSSVLQFPVFKDRGRYSSGLFRFPFMFFSEKAWQQVGQQEPPFYWGPTLVPCVNYTV